MAFQDDKKVDRRDRAGDKTEASNHATENEKISAPSSRPRKRNLPATNVGDALKSAYQRTIDENIPPEMLDLLGKLR